MHCLPAVLLVSAVSVVGWHTVAARPVKCAGRFKNGDCGPDQYCGTESQRCEECSYICDRVHFPDGSCTSKCPHYGKTSSPPPTTPTTPTIPVIATTHPTKAPMEKDVTANTTASTEYSKDQTLGWIIGGVLLAILAVGGLGIFACVCIPKLKHRLQTTLSQDSAPSPAIVNEAAPLMDQNTRCEAVDLSSRSGEVVATSRSSRSVNPPSTSTYQDFSREDRRQTVRPTSATHTASTSADFTDPSRYAGITLAQVHLDGQGLHTNGEEMKMQETDQDTTHVKERYQSDDASPPSSNPPSHLSKRIKEAGQSDCNVQMATPHSPVSTAIVTIDMQTVGTSTTSETLGATAHTSTSSSTTGTPPCKHSGVSTASSATGTPARQDAESSTISSAPRTPARKDSGSSTAFSAPGMPARKDSGVSTASSVTGRPARKDSGTSTASSAPGMHARKDSGVSANSSATGMPARKDSGTSTTSSAPGTMSRKDSGISNGIVLTASSSTSLDSAASMLEPKPKSEPEPKPEPKLKYPEKETRCPIRVSDTNSQANRQVPPIRASRDVP